MRKIAIGIISAFVGGAMLVSGAGAASADRTDTQLKIRDITPNPVVVKAGSETTAYFDIGASSDVKKVELSVAPEEGMRTMRTKDVRDLEGWRFAIGFNENDAAGKWKATAVAFDSAGKEIAKDSAFFAVDVQKGKAETRISRFTADPYKVRKGKSIYFSGRLQVDEDGWEGVRGERVNIYHRANGSSGWKYVAGANTKWGGKFYAKARAYKSGTFRAVFSGSDELDGATSRTDYVRVYGYGWRR
ncbi:hypothetical protein SAMN05444920_103386 [Nonomuraea solani]|uniref:Uncharacterized protein n=1 Tax=Nonomuraea solani TaxID=1144553 RepID=A0A1H6BGF1_9ACTN|nr:hypothetical protein [Nonomuraea solani]SEG59839.1 hypothetical protein SAMN05444920_103386 [Nonomuraea solani]